MDPNRITYFGETDFRNQKTRFGIKAIDRTKHVYVIGKSGMGKSTLLENMAVQDIINGEGIALIDPHGGTAEKMLHYVPDSRIDDVIYFAPFDLEYPISLNVMEDVGPDKRHLVASGLMSAFKKIWVDAWSARMEYILNNTILALLEYPGATLLSVNKMLSDKDFRKDVLSHVTDLSVKSFWVDEFAKYTERMAQEAVPAIQNKVGQFTANPVIRNIIGNPKSSFDFRQAMDTKKIVLINLSKGRLGEQNASLLGALIITKIYLAAMSRADAPESVAKNLPSFNFFVDEFQSFASDSFADILSEARKYKLCLHLAHQYVEQMSEQVRAAVLGNVGTMIVFRVGSTDALIFEKEFAPVFTAEDIVNLDFTQMYLRMTIDGIGSKPFSARGLNVIQPPAYSNKDQAIESSRKNYARPRAEIEEIVRQLLETAPVPPKKTDTANASSQANSSYNNTSFNKPGYNKPDYKSEYKKPDSFQNRSYSNTNSNTTPNTNNKVREAFKIALNEKQGEKEVQTQDEKITPQKTIEVVDIVQKPKGLFAQLEEDVKNETDAVIALEKTYDNQFSTKFISEEKPQIKPEVNNAVNNQNSYTKPAVVNSQNTFKNNDKNTVQPKPFVHSSAPVTNKSIGQTQKPAYQPNTGQNVRPNIAIDQKPKIHSYADRAAKPESMMALKDFLNQVVNNKDNNNSAPKKDEQVVKPAEPQPVVKQIEPQVFKNPEPVVLTKPEPIIEVKPEIIAEEKIKTDSAPNPDPVDSLKSTVSTSTIKEVPEDVLKRILNQD
ncbi:MAG: type IV secretion system DNA-binding domain-containing protein [Candidatus Pacebacteria bacterium]|nr:type IV secretion system DNA-binding domain-containing protein [Candidatus Paceibacterota bacterium]